MSTNEILEHDRPGRKSGIRRLVWRAPREDWGTTRSRLKRMVERVPEVMVKVQGGGTSEKNVLNYMKYISRSGKLLATDEKGERVNGPDEVLAAHASWDLDLCRGNGKLHQSFNAVLSMPKGTDPARLFAAAQQFARDQLGRHQYLMALHTHETDPKQPAPEHPHVHIAIRAEDEDGRRLYIRKDTLRAWRESFAACLRAQGIPANATPRASRGVSLKAKKGAEFHIIKRGARSSALARRFAEAAHDLQHGTGKPKPWEVAMAARRRDVLRELAANAQRLRQEGDTELAAQVEHFAANMPPLDTERHQMKRAIAKQVRNRQQAQEPPQEPDKSA